MQASLAENSSNRAIQVAIVCDFTEERWRAMDMIGDMLTEHLHHDRVSDVEATQVRPRFVSRATRIFPIQQKWIARSTDRLLNRFVDYPRWLRSTRDHFDLFHIVDHSYSQLVHELPTERTIVTCHDLDTFRCLIDPRLESRCLLFRMMTQRILNGFQKAAIVVCDSRTVRDEILTYDLVPPTKLAVIPNGVHPACSAEADPIADAEAVKLLGSALSKAPLILHVGRPVQRKRLDLLLRIFASVRTAIPEVRLVRVGGQFTEAQRCLAGELGLLDVIEVMPFVRKEVLAALYRLAAVVMVTSEREGFGLPVLEALACGTPVVATDLPVLHEVGGEATLYRPLGDVLGWAEAVTDLLREEAQRSDRWAMRRDAAVAQASGFTWTRYASEITALYRELC